MTEQIGLFGVETRGRIENDDKKGGYQERE